MKNALFGLAAFASLLTVSPALAQSDIMSERDTIRTGFLSGMSCRYFIPQATVKFTYQKGGVLLADVRTSVLRGSWTIKNDELCIASPINGERTCNALERSQMRTQAATLALMSADSRVECRK